MSHDTSRARVSAEAPLELRRESGRLETPRRLVDRLTQALSELGVEHAFGLIGGANAPFVDALGRSAIHVTHCRHEGGAAFAATEASLVSGRPALVFATTGPGILNALNGLAAARWEGARVILVSGITSAAQRGRWAAQETSAFTLPPSGIFSEGPLFDYATVVEDVAELENIATRLALGLQRPQGFIAHIALPIAMQGALRPEYVTVPEVSLALPSCSASDVAQCRQLLPPGKFVIWLGFGARHAGKAVLELAERAEAHVLATPRAKGTFPEDHPLYLGTTGMGGHEGISERLRTLAPQRALVLGTKLGEGSSFWSSALVPEGGFVHVDLDPGVPGAAYSGVPTAAVQAEISGFVEALLAEYPPAARRFVPPVRSMQRLVARPGLVRAAFLMQEVQGIVVDGSDAVVMAESGNAFAWASQSLCFREPGRYRVSTGFGSMGHFAAGAVGAAIARGGKVVAIVGDGSMLMNNEVSTAVQYAAPVVWIVLNDGGYGMVDHAMRASGFSPVGTRFPKVDFAGAARAMGAHGRVVTMEGELAEHLRGALAVPGPCVVDVAVDPDEPSPVLARVKSLMKQGKESIEGEQ